MFANELYVSVQRLGAAAHNPTVSYVDASNSWTVDFISRMQLSLGIMFWKKQNLLWLMIVCCATCQITCSKKIMIIGETLTYANFRSFNRSTCPAINVTCSPEYEILIGDFCIVNVKQNTSSLGQCESYHFNITNNGGKYEVRMNAMAENITMLFLPNGSQCLPSNVLNSTGSTSNHIGTCQTWQSTSYSPTTSQSTTTITNKPSNCPSITTTCNASNPDACCLKIPPVDPEKTCRNATYGYDTCSGNEQSKHILHLNGSEWMCVTCIDGRSTTHNPTTSFVPYGTTPAPTVPPPEVTFNLPAGQNDTETPQTNTDKVEPQKAAENLNKVESLVELMEKSNKTNAAIIIGDVIGVLQRQPKDKPTKDIKICYSSSQNMINVVESNRAGYPWSVRIPSEAFDKSRQENNGSAFVGVLRFINMGNKDETKTHTVLNNESYGITMGANISNLTDNIDMTIKKKNLVGNVSCVSWNGKGTLNWTTFGCETKIDNNTIKCSCSHLTFFAVLMSLPDANVTAPHLESLTLISSIGCGISMFFMAIALFMHFLLRKAKSNQATKILMNMFVALFLLNASFLSNESVANTEDNAACVFIALLLHYSMLASFTWFFIQALHMYLWLLRQNVTITNYTRKITVLGWVCAAPIVVAIASVGGYEAVTLSTTSGKIARMCWTTNRYIHYIVNIGYYALVFVFTTGIFIMIVTKVVQARNMKATDGKRKTFRKQLMMVLSLFLLFGLTWSVAFFSYGPMLIPSYYIFTVLNSLQGFFLFLYYYHIHNDVAGHFSDDPDSTDSNTTITQSSITAVENIYN
ncbi:adhesion G-protein coupled receptor G1-like [Onychostoma macrolepis]|uniref:Adhesion G-protein coupled receptor G2-like n=1 Tax=Onychostoma macrolepis TaxID=369639 RepID=A0A7J6C5C4_9TELE|nr:adhesion G-protein coupled receptor G1-like [Onychostoma macrolepis]KAF4101825.1 hypothetical protein G5714_016625 [Onychostoma macrolepis]